MPQLRIVDSAGNKMNRRGNVNSTSCYKGVSFDTSRCLWRAQIKAKGRARLIGRYETELDAAEAYNVEAAKYFGALAHLNRI
jgi:hypothetical protein